MRTGRASGWPLYLVAAVPGAVTAGLLFLKAPKAVSLSVALMLLALVVLLRLGRRPAVMVCILGASFFAGAPVKFGQLNVCDVFLLGALGFILLHPDDTRARMPAPRLLLVGVGLVIVGGLIGGLFQPAADPYQAFSFPYPKTLLFFPPRIGEALRFAWGTIGVILLVRACRLTPRQVDGALMAYGIGATVSVAWALFSPGRGSGRAQGLTAHPVELGLISAVAGLVGIGLLLSGRRSGRRVGTLIVVASVIGIALSGTRAALLVLVVGVGILQFGLRSARRTALFLLLAPLALALAVLGGGGTSPVGTRLAGNASAELSNVGRAALRHTSENLARHHAITGIGFRYFFPPHNLFLAVLSAAGVIGLLGLAVLVVSLVYRLAVTRAPPTLAALAAALAIYVSFWVLNPGWDRWLWVPIALACAVGRSTPGRAGPEPHHGRSGISEPTARTRT